MEFSCAVLFFLATDHVHGVLALGQRGQLGLGVVQAHSLPQGPKVTWVALLSTKKHTHKNNKRHEKVRTIHGLSSSAVFPLRKPTFLTPTPKYCTQKSHPSAPFGIFLPKKTVGKSTTCNSSQSNLNLRWLCWIARRGINMQ